MSELAGRINSTGQTHSMELIFFPVFILFIVGIFANNLSNVGLQTTPALPTPTCQQTAICYATNTNGCDQNATQNCSFNSNTKFSFLNSNSPFAYLLQGNVIGFFGCLTGCPSTAPVSNFFYASSCTNFLPSSVNNSFITAFYCGSIHLYSSTGGVGFGPYNATGGGNNTQWFIQGNPPASAVGYQPTFQFYGIYKTNGTTFVNKYCDAIGFCIVKNVFTCTYDHTSPFNATNVEYCLAAYTITNTTNLSNTFGVFGFVLGLFLLLAGLGLYIGFQVVSTGTTVAVNEQATKMCEVFGFGLLVWSFLDGEFGNWLTSLPFNLGTIVFLGFTMMFFMGLYWRLFSLD